MCSAPASLPPVGHREQGRRIGLSPSDSGAAGQGAALSESPNSPRPCRPDSPASPVGDCPWPSTDIRCTASGAAGGAAKLTEDPTTGRLLTGSCCGADDNGTERTDGALGETAGSSQEIELEHGIGGIGSA